MKNGTTFVRMRSSDHLGDAKKMSKRASRSTEFNFFINCDRQKRFLQNERRRADIQKASDFLIFGLGLSYDLSKFSDDFTPFSSTLKDHMITKSPECIPE